MLFEIVKHNCDVCYIELIQDMTTFCLKIKFWNCLFPCRMLQPLPKSDGRSSANCPRPACPTTMAVQTPKPLITDVTPSPSLTAGTSRSVQGAKSCVIYVMMTERENLFTLISVCPVTPVAAPRAPGS